MRSSVKKNILVIIACPESETQAYLVTQAIEHLAQMQQWKIKVENRGVLPKENVLFTVEDIAQADLVLIAGDETGNLSPFIGKPLYHTTCQAVLTRPDETFQHAFKTAEIYTGTRHIEPNLQIETYLGKCAVKKGAHRVALIIILLAVAFSLYFL